MGKEDSKILNSLGKDAGFRVPEGYFEDFNARMSSSLPDVELTKKEAPTLWTRIRPFVYMAAMFAGVWLMLHMFQIGNNINSPEKRSVEVSTATQNKQNEQIEKQQDNGNNPSFDVMTYEDSVAAGLQRK